MLNESFLNELNEMDISTNSEITGKELADMLGFGDVYDESKRLIQSEELKESKKKFFRTLNKIK